MTQIENFKNGDLYSRLKEKSGSERYPLKCQWEITCRCNFKCVMCYTDCFNNAADIAKELSTEEILRVMDELKEAGVLELTLTGGEPMARADFEIIYSQAVRSGFLTDIYTNGAYITEKWIEIWKKLPPNNIEISLHGLTVETFDQVTARPGSFEKVLAAVDLLVQNKIPLTLKMTGLPMNQHEILQVKAWVKSLPGVNFRFGSKIRKLANGAEDSLKYQLPAETLLELYAQDEEFNRCFCEQSENAQKPGAFSCNDARMQFHIDAYGNLQLCSGNRLQSYSLRSGSFEEGFYKALPNFPCPFKGNATTAQAAAFQNTHENDRTL